MSNVSEEMLMAYVDGELDPRQAAVVERAMRGSPGLAADVARARALRARLRDAHATVLAEAPPRRLLELARGAPVAGAAASAGGVPAAGRRPRGRDAGNGRQRRWHWPEWTALAASLALGVLVAPWLRPAGDPELLQVSDRTVLAGGALANALDTRTSGGDADGIAIGLGLRAADGGYCRTFVLARAPATAGLACRQAGQWRVVTLGEARADAAGLRPASVALPPAVLAAVDAWIGDGAEPLDAAGEREALRAGWE